MYLLAEVIARGTYPVLGTSKHPGEFGGAVTIAGVAIHPGDCQRLERARLQFLFKLAGTVTAASQFWLYTFGCSNLVVPVSFRVF